MSQTTPTTIPATAPLRYPKRISDLRALFPSEEEAIDALIVSDLENVRYLTGFTGSHAMLILSAEHALFLTDGRYLIQSAHEVPGCERVILPQGTDLAEAAAEQIKKTSLRRIGFEGSHLSFNAHAELAKAMTVPITLTSKKGLVESLRQIKDAGEIAAMRKAIALADACFDYVQGIAKPGMTELELAWEMEVYLRQHGASQLSFESIVASGPHSALPHARPTDRRLGETGEPEFVILDYGAVVDGYCSDITRTIVVNGQPTERHRTVYEAVRYAQQSALDAIKPGMNGKDVDTLARDMITKAGFGEQFPHGLGHALGRVVHDGMAFSQKSKLVLAAGMVLTVEPGIYIEGFGGVRIEDDILVTETGCEVLTKSTKDLLTVG